MPLPPACAQQFPAGVFYSRPPAGCCAPPLALSWDCLFLERRRPGLVPLRLKVIRLSWQLSQTAHVFQKDRSWTQYQNAAHEPVSELNFGIVAKIDLSEI